MSQITIYKGLFRLRGEGGGVKGSKIELAKNRLILGQFYSIFPQSKQTIRNRYIFEETGILLKEREREGLWYFSAINPTQHTKLFRLGLWAWAL